MEQTIKLKDQIQNGGYKYYRFNIREHITNAKITKLEFELVNDETILRIDGVSDIQGSPVVKYGARFNLSKATDVKQTGKELTLTAPPYYIGEYPLSHIKLSKSPIS